MDRFTICELATTMYLLYIILYKWTLTLYIIYSIIFLCVRVYFFPMYTFLSRRRYSKSFRNASICAVSVDQVFLTILRARTPSNPLTPRLEITPLISRSDFQSKIFSSTSCTALHYGLYNVVIRTLNNRCIYISKYFTPCILRNCRNSEWKRKTAARKNNLSPGWLKSSIRKCFL